MDSREDLFILKDKLKDVVDLRDYASNYMIPLKTSGKSHKYRCPFHNDKNNPNLAVYEKRYHCFNCKAGGDVFDLIMFFEKISMVEAVKQVASEEGYSLDGYGDKRSVKLHLSAKEYDVLGISVREAKNSASVSVKKHNELIDSKFNEYKELIGYVNASITNPNIINACNQVVEKLSDMRNKALLS